MENDYSRCQGIIFSGRSGATGGRTNLIPPRRCRRPIVWSCITFCGIHAKQAQVQRLYMDLLGDGWEARVAHWEAEREGTRGRSRGA